MANPAPRAWSQVRPVAEDEMFKVLKTGKRKKKEWKRMVTKVGKAPAGVPLPRRALPRVARSPDAPRAVWHAGDVCAARLHAQAA